MENKLTDNEIIKALECCTSTAIGQCLKKCPYYNYSATCIKAMINDVFDLIHRKDAEIERLKDELAQTEDAFNEIYKMNGAYERKIDTIKSEAIKEFAERLCEGKVSNDPVVIAVKTELKLMEGKTK